MLHSRCTSRGYVLVLTLVVIALAGAAMVGASRMALRKVAEAGEAEAELQRRWGVLTARETLLSKAPAALGNAERLAKARVRSSLVSLNLANQAFTFVFSDEQAKVNVNGIYRDRGAGETERVVRSLMPAGMSGDAVRLTPLPEKVDERTGEPEARFASLGQVFEGVRPAELVEIGVSCWGDRALNFGRATPEGLGVVLGRVLNTAQVQRIVDGRNAKEVEAFVGLAKVLEGVQMTRTQRSQVERLLADTSNCYSLWVIVQDGRRRWYHLTVSAPEGGGRALRFDW